MNTSLISLLTSSTSSKSLRYVVAWILPFQSMCPQLMWWASLEKAFWKFEPHIPEHLRNLTASTLRSVALNYIHWKGPKPSKTLLKAIHQLKQREDIIVTKPDKESGVVLMDKDEYLRLLADASINNTTKFLRVDSERPKSRGRPPKHYHPLLQKEKELESLVCQLLPAKVVD